MPSVNSCGSPARVVATNVPSACHWLKCTFTLSPQRGDSPAAPALRTQYLRPLAVVVTGSTSAGTAGGGRPCGGFLGPGTWRGSATAQTTTRIDPTITRAPGRRGAERGRAASAGRAAADAARRSSAVRRLPLQRQQLPARDADELDHEERDPAAEAPGRRGDDVHVGEHDPGRD